MSVICIDAGTTLIKAVGYDSDGREVAVHRVATPLIQLAEGWVEQDMLVLWNAVVTAVQRLTAELSEPVTMMIVTGQGDGVWLVDDAGEPTGSAILWNDCRATEIVDTWRASAVAADVFRVNGSHPFPGHATAILRWLKTNDPQRLMRSSRLLSCSGWIFHRLTGVATVDESNASALFMDIRRRELSEGLLDLLDLDDVKRLLPAVQSGHPVNALTDAAASQLGVPASALVVMAPYDIVTSAIGCGAVSSNQACSILGTTICTEVVADDADMTAVAGGFTLAFGVSDVYLRAFATMSGGGVLQWAADLLHLAQPDDLAMLAAAAPPGSGGVVFLPYLSLVGERSPFQDSHVRGALFGMSFETRREHLARAVFEGLSYVIRHCLQSTPQRPSELRVCGGGSANDFWMQMIANVTGIRVVRTIDNEHGARGAYLVGLVATGQEPSLAAATRRHVVVRDWFHPEPEPVAFYLDFAVAVDAIREVARANGPTVSLARLRQKVAP
jgi:erythritol kinase (D-erythritol 1-phosphate-forming)